MTSPRDTLAYSDPVCTSARPQGQCWVTKWHAVIEGSADAAAAKTIFTCPKLTFTQPKVSFTPPTVVVARVKVVFVRVKVMSTEPKVTVAQPKVMFAEPKVIFASAIPDAEPLCSRKSGFVACGAVLKSWLIEADAPIGLCPPRS